MMKRKILTTIFLSLGISLFAQSLRAGMWDTLLLRQIKSEIGKGNPLYADSYQKLISDANAWLAKPDPTIVNKPMAPPSGDKHDYMSLGRYWWPNPNTSDGLPYIRKDGKTNPEIEKYDRKPMSEFVDGAVKLTLAYYYSERKEYADKAVSLIRTWFLDPKTRQNPNMNYGQAVPGVTNEQGRPEGVIDASGFIYVTDAIELLNAKSLISSDEMSGLKLWFSEFCNWLVHSSLAQKEAEAKNNHSMAYDVQLTRYSIFTGDISTAKRILNEFTSRRLVPQVEADGRQPLELARVTSFHYSVANIGHMIDMCDLGKELGIPIYTAGQKKGSIDMAIQFLIPYIDDPTGFPYKDETLNWSSEAGTFVGLLYRASFYYPDKAKQYRKIYNDFKQNDYLFRLTYLQP